MSSHRRCLMQPRRRLVASFLVKFFIYNGGPGKHALLPSKPPVIQTDRNPLPVALPERVGDRLVVEPVERSEKAAELFPWVRLAWNLGVFDPHLGLLIRDFWFSGMGWGCW